MLGTELEVRLSPFINRVPDALNIIDPTHQETEEYYRLKNTDKLSCLVILALREMIISACPQTSLIPSLYLIRKRDLYVCPVILLAVR